MWPGTAPVAMKPLPVANPELNSSNGFSYVNFGDTWRHLPAKQNAPANWREASFDDAAWSQGAGLLGFGPTPLPAPA